MAFLDAFGIYFFKALCTLIQFVFCPDPHHLFLTLTPLPCRINLRGAREAIKQNKKLTSFGFAGLAKQPAQRACRKGYLGWELWS